MKAAGEALSVKKAPHRPGTAPALGLRAGWVAVAIIAQTTSLFGDLPCGFTLGSIASVLNPNDLLLDAPSASLTDP
jgi:hypothetical protein